MTEEYVLRTAARQKKRMNHGSCTRDLLCLIAAVASARGTIQRARASFTVVPTTRACVPYLAGTLTTELVSLMARAGHRPNCDCERCSAPPMGGNKKSATEFKIK